MGEAVLADDTLIVQTKAPSSVQVGCELLREIVGRRPDVDAVFCNNDDIALGALFECQRLGIAVPERLGIAGFNDFEMSAAAEPPSSSVATERNAMGVAAKIGREHGGTPVTNAHLVCRLLLEKKNTITENTERNSERVIATLICE